MIEKHSYIIIDEHGELYLDNSEQKISDPDVIKNILKNIQLSPQFNLITENEGTKYIVEAFDHPLIAYKLEKSGEHILIHAQFDLIFQADIHKFSLDYQDRICGITQQGAPFVLTEKAQGKLFDSCDEFDDESFTLGGQRIETPGYYFKTDGIDQAKYWMDVYQTEGKPGWDLQKPAEALVDMLPRIKTPKARVLVLGCGEGHDAAHFAQAGHVVTAVDFSKEGLQRGREKYGHLHNLNFVEADIFHLPQEWNHSFDIVFEHTCFCAIPPEKRKDLVTVWRRMLHEEGQLMGVFFAMLKRAGPPYGSSEFEIRDYLKNYFQFLFWGRWRNSLPQRQGRELFILAKKR